MIFNYKTNDLVFNQKMTVWRRQAFFRFSMSVLVVVLTPFAAMSLQAYVAPEIQEKLSTKLSADWWAYYYFAAVLLMWVVIELFARILVNEHEKIGDRRIELLVSKLAKNAGFEKSPKVVYIPDFPGMNAAAFRSWQYGRKILLMGKIKNLKTFELEAVLAHEMAHLLMRDVRVGHVLSVLRTGLGLLFTASSFVMSYWLLRHFLVGSAFAEFSFYATTAATLGAGWRLSKSFYLAYSRTCEYRADAIAIQLTSNYHKEELFNALQKVTELSFLEALPHRQNHGGDFGKTHPTLMKRAASLGLKKLTKIFQPAV